MILVDEGQSPLILCLPHSGSDIPGVVAKRLNATGRLQADIAWRLEMVFDLNKSLDATVIRSSISRYVIDLDQDPSLKAADPTSSGLCPVTTLDGKRIYNENEEPGPIEIEQRSLLFVTPFQRALGQQIDRLMRQHRRIVLIDCQSMRSHIKGVTDKGLPYVSVGSGGGVTCHQNVRNLLAGSFTGQQGVTISVDDVTKGGHIIKTFGRPERGIHAASILLAQRSYLRHESPPFEPDKARIARLQALLSDGLSRLIDWTALEDLESVSVLPPEGVHEDTPDRQTTNEPQNSELDQASDNKVLAGPEFPKAQASRVSQVEAGPVQPLLVAE
ncbi:formiminoglutamase [Roseibium denhamense]|uniref:Formiminoglutamase n=1 Tax=Roseibium denhamense TaxID=76305 RepID=A0ABY1PLM6_9HYPH|nr:N-formylglutamate amidohydrolase [Roseibium denhamense]MTI07017.1 formiminoglutamase [Roseibium denhamense]SMP36570.1 formiminoglutamase [Roseibium denhamense]